MKTKYQVFISSTFEDLKPERDMAIKATLELGHIPVGMEMFSAGDEEQWELIKRQIDDSDYYVVIIAHRYGSTDGRISYTEKEYDYAVANHIPTLGFVIDSEASWPASMIEGDQVAKLALDRFKQKVKGKIINFWKNPEDLHARISIALAKAVTAYPRPGWIRSSPIVGPEVTNELSRLSRENAELRSSLDIQLQQIDAEKRQADEQENVIRLLLGNKFQYHLRFEGDKEFTAVVDTTMYFVFRQLAPQSIVEISLETVARFLGFFGKAITATDKELATSYPVGSNVCRSLLAKFQALGLFEPSKRQHPVEDAKEYWSLTSKGSVIYSAALVKEMEREAIGNTSFGKQDSALESGDVPPSVNPESSSA